MRIHSRPSTTVWCHCRVRDAASDAPQALRVDFRLVGENGDLVADMQGFRAVPFRADAVPEKTGQELHELYWCESRSVATQPAEPGAWLVFTDEDGLGEALSQRLERGLERCVLVQPGSAFAAAGDRYCIRPHEPADYERLQTEAFSGNRSAPRSVVHLWNLRTTPPGGDTAGSLATESVLACGSLLHLIKALPTGEDSPRLWIVTRGAQSVLSEPVSPVQSLAWGLGRTVCARAP